MFFFLPSSQNWWTSILTPKMLLLVQNLHSEKIVLGWLLCHHSMLSSFWQLLCMAVLAYLCYLAWVCWGVFCHVYLLNIVYIKCTMIHNAHFGFPLLEIDNMTNGYKIFTFIITIFFYSYNTINIIHKCTLYCKDFLMCSSSSNLYSLSNLV